MFEQAFKNIDDALRKEAGCTTELDYTEQTSWLLFLKYLDGLEQDRADEAALEGACERVHVLGASQSTRRDFGFMKEGLPVRCYGAFVRSELVGFCSANPICRGVQEISWIAVAPEHRRQGLAAALLTAQATEAFARGEAVGYHAGSAGDDLHAMVSKLGFRATKATYRFVPSLSEEQWRLSWGRRV